MSVPRSMPPHVVEDYLASLRMADLLVTELDGREEEQLCGVTCANGTSASDMLEGLHRALSLVDELQGGESTRADRAALVRVREELLRVLSCVHSQAITAGQIASAAGVLEDFARRMQLLLAMLEKPD